MTLDQFVSQVHAAHGDALAAVLLYGSTAADETATTGHNVAVIVKGIDVRRMQAGGAISRSWQEAGNAVPLVLTEAEWRSSADVFAIEHADIADRHRVLYAAPGFVVIPRDAIRAEDMRRQLEYELLAQVLAVRAAIATAGNDAGDQRAILVAQAGRAVALMRTTLRLSGRSAESTPEGACAAAASLAAFDSAPFLAAIRARRGEEKVARAALGDTLAGFHAGLTKLLAFVDVMPAN
jgi:hypothetical protein